MVQFSKYQYHKFSTCIGGCYIICNLLITDRFFYKINIKLTLLLVLVLDLDVSQGVGMFWEVESLSENLVLWF